jgi:hypothetical protein
VAFVSTGTEERTMNDKWLITLGLVISSATSDGVSIRYPDKERHLHVPDGITAPTAIEMGKLPVGHFIASGVQARFIPNQY